MSNPVGRPPNPIRPCARCGDLSGQLPPSARRAGVVTPLRFDGAKYGIAGWICLSCRTALKRELAHRDVIACADCGATIMPREYHPPEACALANAATAYLTRATADGRKQLPAGVALSLRRLRPQPHMAAKHAAKRHPPARPEPMPAHDVPVVVGGVEVLMSPAAYMDYRAKQARKRTVAPSADAAAR